MWYLKCCIREGWDTFVRYVMCSVGNGTLIHFLHVIKCEDPCLKDSFPELLWIVVDKNASIASYLCGEHSWNPEFKRLPQDRELWFIDNFVKLLYSNFPFR